MTVGKFRLGGEKGSKDTEKAKEIIHSMRKNREKFFSIRFRFWNNIETNRREIKTRRQSQKRNFNILRDFRAFQLFVRRKFLCEC